MIEGDLGLLRCPACRGRLEIAREGGAARADPRAPLKGGSIRCQSCRIAFSIDKGLPRLYREREVRGADRLMRLFYDGLPSLYDPATRYLLPILERDGPELRSRERYIDRLELEALRPLASDRAEPARILEVGVGTGANIPLLERRLAKGLPVELWGLDLSLGMLRVCKQKYEQSPLAPRLVLGDAHALPFPDHAFDRVFHVGALGSMRDGRAALAEMARVARPGSPIVVVDEQLDPARPSGAYARLMFRLLTFYDPDPRCPTDRLPPGALDVLEEQVSRFYYCLRFRTPSPEGRASAD